MAFSRLLDACCCAHKAVGRHVVPIIPDEARTFGLDALFREFGIYSHKGQLYEPVDKESFLYYHETKDGQILEEGITEAGSMSSFIAAGTAYATQRREHDSVLYLLLDVRLPAHRRPDVAGRRHPGEGLFAGRDLWPHHAERRRPATSGRPQPAGGEHDSDACYAYDAAFGYEVATIIAEGLHRMYEKGEELFYYLSLYNEKYTMPAMPEGSREGIFKGLYKFKPAPEKAKHQAHIFGSGPIINEALRAQEILAEKYGVAADVWSATNYKLLRNEALCARRWNMLHPTETPKKSYFETTLEKEKGPFIAVSDNMKIVPDQIAPWVPGGLTTLGTDGFGRSDTRENLRRFFEVDAEMTVIATLYALAEKGAMEKKIVEKAIKDLNVDPGKGACGIFEMPRPSPR